MNAMIPGLSRVGDGEMLGRFATPGGMDCLTAAYHTVHNRQRGGAATLAPLLTCYDKAGELQPMSASTLQHKVNPNVTTHHLHLREARDLILQSGDAGILYALAAECGHAAIALTVDCENLTVGRIAEMAKGFADILTAATTATAEHSEEGTRVSTREMADIETKAIALMGAINCLCTSMRAEMARGAAR